VTRPEGWDHDLGRVFSGRAPRALPRYNVKSLDLTPSFFRALEISSTQLGLFAHWLDTEQRCRLEMFEWV
jgi:hypothetical protein